MFERKSGIILIAGIGFFAIAFLSNAVLPILMYRHLPEKSVKQLVEENGNLRYQFEDLALRFPDSFEKAYGKPPAVDEEKMKDSAERKKVNEWYNEHCAKALQLGHDIYVAEACWHCHSQFVRPVSNEDRRWGPVSKSKEYQNRLQRPVLFGTRRVGPDLSREGGRRSSDWQAVHLFHPEALSKGSPMPRYPWLFDGAADKPTERGLALITYIQWLGSWHETYPYYEDYVPIPIKRVAAEAPAAAAE